MAGPARRPPEMRLASMPRTASLRRIGLLINVLEKKAYDCEAQAKPPPMNRWRATEATEELHCRR